MNYKVNHDIEPVDIVTLRKLNGWKEINLDQFIRGLKNTQFKVSIKSDEEIIACGRIVGDYSCKGVLSDVLVNPKYQKQGFGKIVLTELFKMVEESLKEGEKYQIEATPTGGNREFYVKCGMKYKPENQDGTYLWIEK